MYLPLICLSIQSNNHSSIYASIHHCRQVNPVCGLDPYEATGKLEQGVRPAYSAEHPGLVMELVDIMWDTDPKVQHNTAQPINTPCSTPSESSSVSFHSILFHPISDTAAVPTVNAHGV